MIEQYPLLFPVETVTLFPHFTSPPWNSSFGSCIYDSQFNRISIYTSLKNIYFKISCQMLSHPVQQLNSWASDFGSRPNHPQPLTPLPFLRYNVYGNWWRTESHPKFTGPKSGGWSPIILDEIRFLAQYHLFIFYW